MMKMNTGRLSLCLLGGLLVLSGCHPRIQYTPMEGAYYLNPDVDLSSVGRVALVELDNPTNYSQAGELSEEFYVALQKRQFFGIVRIDHEDPRWRSLQSPLDANYNAEQLLEMRRVLQSDAILTGTVTQFQPFPHLSLGVRIRLIDLRTGELLWGVEQVWDCSDAHTKIGVQYYLQNEMGTEVSPMQQSLVTTSHLHFFKFVSYELAQTLVQ